jgi:hypothetical protein
MLYIFLISSMRAVYPTHLILRNLTTLIIGVREEILSAFTLRGEWRLDVIKPGNLSDATGEACASC